ncbi:hypothetical protein ABGN05_21230 [Aquibium sp. LZ166]|uniref:Uncharacterized protein n=1 Tax=Aquibium pacificus TaxID=3153579 RepID=A0ABV3SPP4_9HYPH
MRIRLSSIRAYLAAVATLLVVSAAPASAGSNYRSGEAAQTPRAEGGQTYRRDNRDMDRRSYRKKAPKGFEGGHSYRRDDHRWDRDWDHKHGYRHQKRRHDDRVRIERDFRSEAGHARRWNEHHRHYRRDDDRRHHGRKHGEDFSGVYSGAPTIVFDVNPWLAN